MAITITPTSTELRVRLTKPKNSSGLISEKLFVIDAGHGGSDPGAQFKDTNETLNEKDFNLDVAKRIAKALSDAGAAVIMTREDDTFIELYARPEIANKAVSHFFISVHFNSNVVANSASGTMTFYHRDDPDARALAECIHAEIVAVTGLPDLGVRSDTTIYQNGFAVLRHSKMPAVLLEIAFINNAVDREAMKNPEFLQRVADAVVKGIRVYLGES
jgi:N-acetylmuramoyl-L-alanine amidase